MLQKRMGRKKRICGELRGWVVLNVSFTTIGRRAKREIADDRKKEPRIVLYDNQAATSFFPLLPWSADCGLLSDLLSSTLG